MGLDEVSKPMMIWEACMSVYFEDLAVGDTFQAGPVVMTAERIKEFGREFDPQPMHTDEALARDSIFGELVASGWHTAAATMRLVADGASPRVAGGVMGAGIESLAWPNPVRPGDQLSAVSELLELRLSRTRPDRGLGKLRTTTTTQDGTVVQVLTVTIVIPCRPVT
jgi:acyl dehydratase